MATSLMSGLIASGYASGQLWVADVNQSLLQAHSERLRVNISADNRKLAEEVEVVVLAVKPSRKIQPKAYFARSASPYGSMMKPSWTR